VCLDTDQAEPPSCQCRPVIVGPWAAPAPIIIQLIGLVIGAVEDIVAAPGCADHHQDLALVTRATYLASNGFNRERLIGSHVIDHLAAHALGSVR
jgi:hypothetical protein